MSEQLIVIRTFASEIEANAVQAALQGAGIQALVVTGGGIAVGPNPILRDIGVAVHERDVSRAEEALSPPPPRPA